MQEAILPSLPGTPPDLAARLMADPAVWRALRRTIEASLAGTALAALIGVAASVALGLVLLPGRRALVALFVLPMLIPPQITALSWITALGPSSALLGALGLAPPLGTPNPMHSPFGIIALFAVQHAPLVALPLLAALRSLPAGQIEAARLAGATRARLLWGIVLPMLLPALVAGVAIAFMACIGNVGIPALLGIPARYTMLTVLIWQRLSGLGPAGLSEAALLSMLLAALAAIAIAVQRLALRGTGRFIATGRGADRWDVGRGRWAVVAALVAYLIVVLVLPISGLVATSLTRAIGVPLSAATATLSNFTEVLLRQANTIVAFRNSLLLSITAAIILVAAALPLALATTGQGARRAGPMLVAIDLPYALPGMCVAVAAILVYLRPLPLIGVSLYGGLGLILIAYLARFQALALKPLAGALARIDPKLDEAAMLAGAGALRRARDILAPLLAPSAATAAILVMLTALNELTVSILLYASGSQTLGVVVFSLNDGGAVGLAAAVSVTALAMVLGLMGLATLAARRAPAGTLPWGV